MRSVVIIIGVVIVLLFVITIWRVEQPVFSWLVNRQVIARLNTLPDDMVLTDLDGDGRTEVLLAYYKRWSMLLCDPLGKPEIVLLREDLPEIAVGEDAPPLKELPVLTKDGRLRLLCLHVTRTTLSRLSGLPDVPLVSAVICANSSGSGTFLVARLKGKPNERWVSLLSPNGEWQPAKRFTDETFAHTSAIISSVADLDRDRKPDAICDMWNPTENAWVLWGKRKDKTLLGSFQRYGSPLVDDLDGDGWLEIAMLASEPKGERVKVWRFDPMQKRLLLADASPYVSTIWAGCYLDLADVDGDDLNELVLLNRDNPPECYVFKFVGNKLRMGKETLAMGELLGFRLQLAIVPTTDGVQESLVTDHKRTTFRFPPRIEQDGWRISVRFHETVEQSVFWRLPKGEAALSPKNWQAIKAPFRLWFAYDVDGDGSDELFGYDNQMRFSVWQIKGNSFVRVWLSKPKRAVTDTIIVHDGKRLALLVWDDGTVERFVMAVRGLQ